MGYFGHLSDLEQGLLNRLCAANEALARMIEDLAAGKLDHDLGTLANIEADLSKAARIQDRICFGISAYGPGQETL